MDVFQSQNKYFGKYGGSYVPDMLITPLEALEKTFRASIISKEFVKELQELHTQYVARPSILYKAHNMEDVLHKEYGAPKNLKVYLKLENLNNTGAHKINNVVGQILLAKAMNKKHIIAETGAGQHGLATAATCAKFKLKCTIFMGETDSVRQYPNVFAMQQMGAEVVVVKEGTKTLKDAVNKALKYWVEHIDTTYYLIGSALGPYPYPEIVQYFQSIIGEEVKQQIQEKEGVLPNSILACVGGGSNALGIFSAFLSDKDVRLIGVEAAGKGTETKEHATRLQGNSKAGIVQGYKSYFLQDEDGQVTDTYSISAGLDYAGISPQLAYLYDTKRIEFCSATDEIALRGYTLLSRTEGMIPALESAHALGMLTELAPKFKQDDIVVVNVSGRGDKDLFIVAPQIEPDKWNEFLSHELNKEQ